MKKINIEEATSFDLEMEIHGDAPSGAEVDLYFTIITEKMRVSFEGQRIEPGLYRISMPPMKNIIKAGKYNFEVEVLIAGKHFKPISETVEFTEEIKPVIKMKEDSKDSEFSIKITESKEQKREQKQEDKIELPAILKKVGLVAK